MATSSSDGELGQRWIRVAGLSQAHREQLRTELSRFGTLVQLVRCKPHRGMPGFLAAFDDEDSAAEAITALKETSLAGHRIHVEWAGQDVRPHLAVLGRRIHRPDANAKGRAGGAASVAVSTCRCLKCTGQVNAAATFPQQRQKHTCTHQMCTKSVNKFRTHVRPLEIQPAKKSDFPPSSLQPCQLSLFSFDTYPHLAKKFFGNLDSASLLRAKLVCKDWYQALTTHVDARKPLLERWRSGQCEISFLHRPTFKDPQSAFNVQGHHLKPSRNILDLQADEMEILVALDNGDVEIYDRQTLELTWILAGKFNLSPVSIDMSPELILVAYRRGIYGRMVRKKTVNAFWIIFDRASKDILHAVEGDESVRLGFFGDQSVLYKAHNTIIELDLRVPCSHAPGFESRELFLPANCSDCLTHFDVDRGEEMGVVVLVDGEERLQIHTWNEEGLQSEHDPVTPVLSKESIDQFLPSDINLDHCGVLHVQLRYPLVMLVLSNNSQGKFEHTTLCGTPYILVAFYYLKTQKCLRMITLDKQWLHKHMDERGLPYDYDTGIQMARFSANHLAIGFGCYYGHVIGGLALWSMDELLDPVKYPEDQLTVVTNLPRPDASNGSTRKHYGGVHAIHIDKYQLIVANGFSPTGSRWNEDSADTVDNILVYDFGTKP